jgi:hypothetical protein
MARQRYSVKESWNKILSLFMGDTISEIPEVMVGEILSENEALSNLTELLNASLPGETFAIPPAMKTGITNAGFASGTASSLVIITGTTTMLTGATRLVFGPGFTVGVTGTSVFITGI